MQRFDASRGTVTKAFSVVAANGLLERRRGSGSFVLPPPLHRQESILRSFTEDMKARGLTPSSKVIATGVGPDPDAAVLLGLPSDEWVVTIERVRYADNIALALEKTSLPRELSAVLDIDLEKESLHREVARLGHRMVRATGYVTARLATDVETKILGLTSSAALLVENRLIVDDAGRPIERTKTAYVGSRWIVDTGSFVVKSA